ncbi:S9 family peptidase [Streptomyces bobili]|uniref:S9 family peptidase n=1 Tax=Streptomyces bobili TaxID=67280 RepID=UPI00382BF104
MTLTDGGRTVWWAQTQAAEAGRTTVMRQPRSGSAVEMLPSWLDARTRVHEYGGRCWLPVGDGLVTSHFADQRLYLVDAGIVTALTPDTGLADRYGEPVLLPGGTHVLCVRERMAQQVTRALVAVPLDGSADIVELWDGSDFVVGAAVSPDGTQLAFLTWDRPQMPWDGSLLRVAALQPGPVLGPVRTVLGGPEESVLAPAWDTRGELCAVTDRSGWWNPVRVQTADDLPCPLWQGPQDCGYPLWQLGFRSIAPLSNSRMALLRGGKLTIVDAAGAVTEPDIPVDHWAPWIDTSGDLVVGVASSPHRRPSVVLVDTAAGTWQEIASPEQPDPAWSPPPERAQITGAGGRRVHAVHYPPTSPEAALADGEAPPCVMFVHGGPTASFPRHHNDEVAYFTSRGLAVVAVDYAGSSGYGRAYRTSLNGHWGIYDVEDCEAAARWMTNTGRASAVAIRGISAGGFTAMCALTRPDTPFTAGTSYYGSADLNSFAAETTDFEAHYLHSLIGPLPHTHQLRTQRSPLTHADMISRPLLLLQGLDDPIVPPGQAEAIARTLAHKNIPHTLLRFPGEAHGFHKQETITAALEAELNFYAQTFGFQPPGSQLSPHPGDASASTSPQASQ